MECFGCSKQGIKNVIFDDEIEYQQHYISTHLDGINNRNSYLKCPECGKINKSWYNFVAHTTTHRQYCQPPWICNYTTNCNKRCSTRHNLTKHIQSHHNPNLIVSKNSNKNNKTTRNNNNNNNNYHNKKQELLQKKKRNKSTKKRQRKNNNKKNKKLRPKMEYIASPRINPINSRKRKLNHIDIDNDNQPKSKRFKTCRINHDINSQINFLNLLYSAAIYIDKNEESLSPQSPILQ